MSPFLNSTIEVATFRLPGWSFLLPAFTPALCLGFTILGEIFAYVTVS